MFEKNYYTLVAGLREYTLDADTKGFDARGIVAEIVDGISEADAREVRLLYAWYDCGNLIALRSGRSAFDGLGNLAPEELAEALQRPDDVLPREVAEVVRAYADPEGEDAERVDTSRGFARSVMEAYYAACSRSSSRFLRQWSEFDRNVRNIVAAVAARAAGRPVEEAIVGGGDAAEQLRRSSAADFGLRGELSYVEPLIAALSDEENLVEKERKIDLVRWNEAVELTAFDYFNINAILSYLVRIDIVARWSALDERRGRELLARLMAELDGKELINNK